MSIVVPIVPLIARIVLVAIGPLIVAADIVAPGVPLIVIGIVLAGRFGTVPVGRVVLGRVAALLAAARDVGIDVVGRSSRLGRAEKSLVQFLLN